jgi:hypothetical protein
VEQQQTATNREIEALNTFYKTCLAKLQTTGKGELVLTGSAISQQLTDKLQQVGQLAINTPGCQPRNPLHQHFQTRTFTLQQFSKVRKDKGEVLFEPFEASYSLWRLKVYPGGFAGAKLSERHKGIEYMSVYVERLEGILREGTFFLELSMTSLANPTLEIRKSFQSEFMMCESWGYDRYTRVTNIYDCGFLGPDDTIIISVSVCPVTYFETNRALDQIANSK